MRKIIKLFAERMEAKLAMRDAKYGPWREQDAPELWDHFDDEAEELREAFHDTILDEAVDVALMAMMIADHEDPICEHDGRGNEA